MKKALLTVALLTQISQAKELIGVKMPDEVVVDGKKLILNGMGLRKKSIVLGISVDVYVGGLYLEKPTHDASEILASAGPKRMHMTFARNIDKDKLKEAWSESFEKNCGTQGAALKPKLAELQNLLKDVNEDDSLIFTFVGDKLTVEMKAKKGEPKTLGEITSKDFSKVALSAWIGNPPNPELKDGLLGNSQPK